MKIFISPFNTAVLNLSLKSGIWTGVAAVTAVSTSLTVYSHFDEIKVQGEFIKGEIEKFIGEKVKPFFQKYIVDKFDVNILIDGYRGIWDSTKSLSKYALTKGNEWGKLLLEKTRTGELWQSFLAGGRSFPNEVYDFLFELRGYLSYAEKLKELFDHSFNQEIIKSVLEGAGRMMLNSKELTFKLFSVFGSEEFQKAWGQIPNKDFWNILSVFFSWLKVGTTHSPILTSLTQDDWILILEGSFEDVNGLNSRASELFWKPIKRAKGESVEDLKENVLDALFPEVGCVNSKAESFLGAIKDGTVCTLKKKFTAYLWKNSRCEEGKECDRDPGKLIENLKDELSTKISKNFGLEDKKERVTAYTKVAVDFVTNLFSFLENNPNQSN